MKARMDENLEVMPKSVHMSFISKFRNRLVSFIKDNVTASYHEFKMAGIMQKKWSE
ncbi:MAG: hypothetical protein ABJB85_05760 [Nitrososphaerota archaeon]